MWLNHNLDEVFQFWLGFGIATSVLLGIEYKFDLKTFIGALADLIKWLLNYADERFKIAKKRHARYKHAKRVIRREIN
jgi:hypothetical protein